MICQSHVKVETRRRKGSGTPYESVRLVMTGYPYGNGTRARERPELAKTLEGTEECGGRIVARVAAEDEPYYGGTSARLAIEYCCERCTNTHFPSLPQDGETLAAWLTTLIAAMPTQEET